ncbi:MAG: ABC transporter ATP-binding protein [Kaiparowitsia implicata GSE-PSE-MK54-09C]|jgi:peptide/nickel transport system ATP-binding protein|nr:ABC transporter ATP-binding protein [Kaiparowitsia implicata GSE-PSE-MK54-09C]
MTSALLTVDRLRIAYPYQRGGLNQAGERSLHWAVDDVSFTLNPGERLGLVGESGCGKSTLGRGVVRLLPQGSQIEGSAYFNGQAVFDLSPAALRRFRGEAVAIVFQDPMTRLDPLMTIGEHCLETLLAHEPQLSRRAAKDRAIATLEAVNIPASRWAQYPHEFSGGMRQRVAIALALVLNPRLIVADEPTTSLDVTIAAQILTELTRLCQARDMALLMISHDLALVGEYCDRIAVMYEGKFVESGATAAVLRQPQHAYTQSLLKAALHIQAGAQRPSDRLRQGKVLAQRSPDSTPVLTSEPIALDDLPCLDQPQGEPSGEVLDGGDRSIPAQVQPCPILHLEHLSKDYTLEQNLVERLLSRQPNLTIKAVDDVTLDLYPGEILGLVGESGCGKSTLSRTILQLIPASTGRIEFLGTDLTQLSRHALRQQRRYMQMVFQDPHACLNPLMTVGHSIADPLLVHKLATAETARPQVLDMLSRVGLTPAEEYYDRYPGDLSGGQQQRVAIARALITRPKLLICDEPVSMLDASVQSQVLELMLDLKREFELTYLFITHDLWLARFLCDRIAVMHAGQIVEIGPTVDIFNHPQHPYTQTLLAAAPLLARQGI